MNGARNELLARARRADDAGRHIAPGHARDHRVDVSHDLRFTNDAFDRTRPGDRANALFLLDEAAEATVLSLKGHERGHRLARPGAPPGAAIDEDQLALVEDHPILTVARRDTRQRRRL